MVMASSRIAPAPSPPSAAKNFSKSLKTFLSLKKFSESEKKFSESEKISWVWKKFPCKETFFLAMINFSDSENFFPRLGKNFRRGGGRGERGSTRTSRHHTTLTVWDMRYSRNCAHVCLIREGEDWVRTEDHLNGEAYATLSRSSRTHRSSSHWRDYRADMHKWLFWIMISVINWTL